jgi:hypothetical protein
MSVKSRCFSLHCCVDAGAGSGCDGGESEMLIICREGRNEIGHGLMAG